MHNLTAEQIELANRAMSAVRSIIKTYAHKLNVDEETALKMVRENIDSPNVTGAIKFAAEIYSNDKVLNALKTHGA